MRHTRFHAVAALAVAAALLVSGCGPRYDVENVRARADEMSARIMEAYYDSDAYGHELDVAGIIAEYRDLADPGLVRFVGSLRDREQDPRRRKQLDFLFYDLVSTAVWHGQARFYDEIANIEATGRVTVGEDEFAYRDLGIELYNETDSATRKRYYLALGEFAVARTNPLRKELIDSTRERLKGFRFSDLDDYEAARRGIDFDAFEDGVVAFLEETNDIYLDLTSEAAREVFGVEVTEVEDYDRGRLFRGAEFDQYFPAGGTVGLLEDVLLGMGIDLGSLPAVRIDDEDRPDKEPRAASYAVVPGEDVRILVKPAGGVGDYESLFHEMGHALHDAYIGVEEYEFQRLGDYGTTEAYAYILEDLLSDERFIEETGLIEDADVLRRFLRKQLLSDLGSARYYAGLMRYERRLHRGELSEEELVAAYGELIGESRLVPLEHPEFGYLADNEDFYGVNYLEAWFLAAQLRAALGERFGETWWAEPAAGEFLKELWEFGAELPPEEVAQRIGYDGLDSAYYINEVRAAYAAYR